jgi:hypothetical protein
MSFCSQCGREVGDAEKHCNSCGQAVADSSSRASKKPTVKYVGLLLGLLSVPAFAVLTKHGDLFLIGFIYAVPIGLAGFAVAVIIDQFV